MTEEGFKRKLAAILSADVEGYSRLMDDDEESTIADKYHVAKRQLFVGTFITKMVQLSL
jgi:class 3 adenylate cyclase